MRLHSAQGVAGQSINPRFVAFPVQKPAAFGHCRHGLGDSEAGLLEKLCKDAISLARINAGESTCQLLQMDRREMDRVLVVSGYCGANHMATPELATHGIADDLAATAQSGYRGILCEQREQPGAVCSECARVQRGDLAESVARQLTKFPVQSWHWRECLWSLSLAHVYDRLAREAE